METIYFIQLLAVIICLIPIIKYIRHLLRFYHYNHDYKEIFIKHRILLNNKNFKRLYRVNPDRWFFESIFSCYGYPSCSSSSNKHDWNPLSPTKQSLFEKRLFFNAADNPKSTNSLVNCNYNTQGYGQIRSSVYRVYLTYPAYLTLLKFIKQDKNQEKRIKKIQEGQEILESTKVFLQVTQKDIDALLDKSKEEMDNTKQIIYGILGRLQ